MVHPTKESDGSQFYLTIGDAPWLDGELFIQRSRLRQGD